MAARNLQMIVDARQACLRDTDDTIIWLGQSSDYFTQTKAARACNDAHTLRTRPGFQGRCKHGLRQRLAEDGPTRLHLKNPAPGRTVNQR